MRSLKFKTKEEQVAYDRKKYLEKKRKFIERWENDKMSIGYHYTSYENWLEIKKKGLVPYEIVKPELQHYFPNKKIMGVWVWVNRFHGAPHAGSVLHQVAYKASPRIVLLSVDYSMEDILMYKWPDGRLGDVYLHHDGHIEKWVYHTGKEESVIVTKRIPPSHIKLLREWDIVELLK